MTRKNRSALFGGAVSCLIIAGSVFMFFQKQALVDWFALRNYSAPTQVENLALQTTMDAYGKKIFYVNRPQVQDKAQFYASCNENEKTVVLGCYKSNEGIFLLQVTDARLKGVEEVTAAHEMLHAGYERLSGAEKADVRRMVLAAYDQLVDPGIREKIDLYKAANADIPNELHSILGTEVEDLPAGLEQYYRKYFTNRKRVVTFANTYKAEFQKRKDTLNDYNAKLDNLQREIESNNSVLDGQIGVLESEQKRLSSLRASGDIATYNASVNPYNQKVSAYNALVSKTRAMIDTYKALLEQRNQVAEEAQELTRALDSRIFTREQL